MREYSENEELFYRYVETCERRIEINQTCYDKFVALSAIVFLLASIVLNYKASALFLLAALVFILFSFAVGAYEIAHALIAAEKYYLQGKEEYRNKRTISKGLLILTNRLAGAFLIIGIFFIIL